ncbi:DOMON domain containing protein [Parasponia andersonii]|uniref:DOMON domain containing protein n=1 Tax=Parasponia andersonii TaxID=3476 RepID=A0A2P5CRG0_PARAD|nr:DOMON domain containing protein [Parasponia andersonii]
MQQVFTSLAQTCSNHNFSANRHFSSCRDLPVLQAQLFWSYIPSTRSVNIAYKAAQESTGWVAWAINPTGTGMVGSQAIVAFHGSNGNLTSYPTAITSYSPSMQPSSLSFQVANISAVYAKGEMTIFSVVGPLANVTSVNLVWQAGNSVSGNIPQAHPISGPNIQAMTTIDFLSA